MLRNKHETSMGMKQHVEDVLLLFLFNKENNMFSLKKTYF